MGGKSDAKVLRDAAEVIRRRLIAGERVRIPGFGAFYLKTILVELAYPGCDESGPKVRRHKVYFKPFRGLKGSIRDKFD
jgi:nucleoid DNA-binding protein